MYFSTTTSVAIPDQARCVPRLAVTEKLDHLRAELAEMAFALDRRGRPEAADVVMTISGRVGEILDEIAQAEG